MARPPHMPEPGERRQVEAMAAYGIPEADIARVIGIDPKTLRKHYRDELDTGHVKANARVAEVLFKKATGDGPQSVTAAIFWLKTRAGWREARPLEDETAPTSLLVRWMSADESKAIAAPSRDGPPLIEAKTDD
ncbi:MAG: hypothetical protein RLO50_15045 [Azospirillaceae bacterium]